MCLAIERLKDIHGVDRAKINAFIKEHKNKYVESILNRAVGYKLGEERWEDVKDELYEYIPSFVIIIEELLENEQKDWIDIKKINEGSFLTTFQIGEKVLKVGIASPNEHEIPNHRIFLQPLLRRNILHDKSVSVVIQEKIEPCELHAEELYKVYKELRDDGIYATDFKPSNLGITRKPNVIHFKGVKDVAPEAVGFDRGIDSQKVLPAGEAVLFDLDYCYDEKNLEVNFKSVAKLPWPSDIAIDFEKRYRKEKGLQDPFKKYIMDSTMHYFMDDDLDYEFN